MHVRDNIYVWVHIAIVNCRYVDGLIIVQTSGRRGSF